MPPGFSGGDVPHPATGREADRRTGLALLVVVGVLGLLAVLGAAFVTLAQLERRASRQRLYATKAMLLARSGIEDAMARLSAGQDPDAAGSRYGGEDWDASGTLNGFEGAAEVYRPGVLDVDACPTQQALRPSFFARSASDLGADLLPAPARVQVEGRPRGYSGALAGDLGAEGNLYAVRVHTEGGLYLNGGDPSQRPPVAGDYNMNLRRILGILAEAVDREDGMAGDGPVAQADGFSLIDARPPTALGWESWEQVRDIALGGSQAKLDALRPYLTLHALVDKKVIRPNAVPGLSLPGMENRNFQSWADIKLAHRTYPGLLGPPTKAPDFERIPVRPPSMGGKLVGRAPVDLAWARSRRPVLIALLASLKGLYLDESTARPISTGDLIGTIRSAQIGLSWIPSSDLMTAVSLIMNSPDALGTWDKWDAFCDAIPFSGATTERQAKRDILKANFNPNSRLNKFSPNLSLWKSVDKSDLLVYSTEFSLLPQAHPREMESLGRILGRDGRLLANRVLRISIAHANRVTLTTQKEFVCEDLGDLSVAGDEQALRQPGFTESGKAPFVSEGQSPGGRTWGQSLDVTAAYPESWMEGGSRGASLQTYPEPCVIAGPYGTALSTRAADYDGSLQLATVETVPEEFYGVLSPTRDMKLLARYTAGLDLDLSDAAPSMPLGDARWRNQPDIQQVTYNGGGSPNLSELGNGLLDAARPNTLYPDGVYSEKDRAVSYLDRDNANGIQGLISFWIKSNHVPPTSSVPRGHPFLKWTNASTGSITMASPSQFFFLGEAVFNGPGVCCQFEISHIPGDTKREHRYQKIPGPTPHLWSLVTMYYDFRSPGVNDHGELLINAGLPATVPFDAYSGAGNDPASASDITLPDIFGAHRIVLGKGHPEIEINVPAYTGSGADATFDELTLYDFGGADAAGDYTDFDATLDSPRAVAFYRFKEGRYYKESDYPASDGLLTAPGPLRNAAEYFSPPIRIGPCRIRALAWTQVVPRGLGAPLPAGRQAGVDGDPGDDGRIVLELSNVVGSDYPRDTTGVPIDRTFDRPASSPVDRTVNAPFRLHAVFQPNLDDPDNTPILDPLALDDVTVVYEPLEGRRVLTWEEGVP